MKTSKRYLFPYFLTQNSNMQHQNQRIYTKTNGTRSQQRIGKLRFLLKYEYNSKYGGTDKYIEYSKDKPDLPVIIYIYDDIPKYLFVVPMDLILHRRLQNNAKNIKVASTFNDSTISSISSKVLIIDRVFTLNYILFM